MFESLSAKFQGAFASLRSKGRLKASDIDEITLEIRSALLDSDVAISVVDFFIEQLKIRTNEVLEDLNKSTNPANAVFEIVNSFLFTHEILAKACLSAVPGSCAAGLRGW